MPVVFAISGQTDLSLIARYSHKNNFVRLCGAELLSMKQVCITKKTVRASTQVTFPRGFAISG